MYRKLLATTALSLVLAGGAYAQDAMAPAGDMPADPAATEMAPADGGMAPAGEGMEAEPQGEEIASPDEAGINSDGWLASEVMGSTIYTAAGEEAESIGNVNDFVLDADGGVAAVVVGVGGFLGIGEKSVAINWEDLELTTDPEGEQRLVSSMTREQLDNAAEFDREAWLASENAEDDALVDGGGAMAPMTDPAAPAAGDPTAGQEPMAEGEAPADAEPMAEEPAAEEGAMTEEPMAEEPAGEAEAASEEPAAEEPMADEGAVTEEPAAEEGAMTEENAMAEEEAMAEGEMGAEAGAMADLEMVAAEEISADDLTGTPVYGADDEEIGTIDDILLTEEGTVEAVIIDFGGFLGIGSKPVAIAYQNLEFYVDAGDSLVLRTALTAEDLEAAPEYDEGTYMDAPNEQLVTLE